MKVLHEYGEFIFNTDSKKYSNMVNTISNLPSADLKKIMVNYFSNGYADGYPVYDMASCPNCDYEFEESNVIWGCDFCPDCGQALKWEEE